VKRYLLNFNKYKPLLRELIKRDLKTKYRRSILGYLWSLLNPLMMMIVVSLVFSYMFRFDIPNYPMYLLTGQILFNFLSESTNMAMTSLINSASLINKVYVPKYIFPLSRVLSSFVNLLFSLVAILLMLIITKTPITPAIFLLPIPLIFILLYCIGLGMILSILAVYFRDTIHLYGIIITAWTYFTPIFYPVSLIPNLAKSLMNFNPMFHFINVFRDIVMYGKIPTLDSLIICFVFSLSTLAIGMVSFKKLQHNIILHL
jgi:ABC-2 type transport system permease protein